MKRSPAPSNPYQKHRNTSPKAQDSLSRVDNPHFLHPMPPFPSLNPLNPPNHKLGSPNHHPNPPRPHTHQSLARTPPQPPTARSMRRRPTLHPPQRLLPLLIPLHTRRTIRRGPHIRLKRIKHGLLPQGRVPKRAITVRAPIRMLRAVRVVDPRRRVAHGRGRPLARGARQHQAEDGVAEGWVGVGEGAEGRVGEEAGAAAVAEGGEEELEGGCGGGWGGGEGKVDGGEEVREEGGVGGGWGEDAGAARGGGVVGAEGEEVAVAELAEEGFGVGGEVGELKVGGDGEEAGVFLEGGVMAFGVVLGVVEGCGGGGLVCVGSKEMGREDLHPE